jgi:hypothetical protein
MSRIESGENGVGFHLIVVWLETIGRPVAHDPGNHRPERESHDEAFLRERVL